MVCIGERLKPNMYARVRIFGGPRRDVLSIRGEALIRSGGADRVVVALGDGRFRVHEVEVGIESGDWVEIRRGLSPGDRIVTSAQFLLDSPVPSKSTVTPVAGSTKLSGPVGTRAYVSPFGNVMEI